MLIAEARAIGAALAEIPAPGFPIANIGSQSRDFSTRTQPWIQDQVFGPLANAGHRVVNVDLTRSDGVDVVADVSTPAGRRVVRAAGTRSVLCSNLLEHVDNPVATLAALSELVAVDSYLVVSGPRHYPHHPDPIDNGFRPTALEVTRLLPADYRVVRSVDVRCRRLLRYDLGRVRRALGDRDRHHSAAPDGVPHERPTARQLLTRALWTLRRPSCYLVVARRTADRVPAAG